MRHHRRPRPDPLKKEQWFKSTMLQAQGWLRRYTLGEGWGDIAATEKPNPEQPTGHQIRYACIKHGLALPEERSNLRVDKKISAEQIIDAYDRYVESKGKLSIPMIAKELDCTRANIYLRFARIEEYRAKHKVAGRIIPPAMLPPPSDAPAEVRYRNTDIDIPAIAPAPIRSEPRPAPAPLKLVPPAFTDEFRPPSREALMGGNGRLAKPRNKEVA